MRGIAPFAGLFLLALAGADAGAQATAPAWKYTARDSVRSIVVTPLGSLAVRAGSDVTVLDAGTGQPLWSRRASIGVRVLTGSSYALVQDSIPELVDLETGTTRWWFRGVRLNDLRPFVWMPERGELLLSGVAGDSFVVTVIDAASGVVRWRRTDWFSDSLNRAVLVVATQPPLHDSDTTFILYPSHLGLIRVDARTGAILWRSGTRTGQRIPNVNEGHAPAAVLAGRVLVPYEQRLLAIDQATAVGLWERDFPAEVVQLAMTARGLLIRGKTLAKTGRRTSFVHLVHPATGASVWTQPIARQGSSSNFQVTDERAFVVLGGQLFTIDFASGAAVESLKVQFKGGEDPLVLERHEGRLLLSSSQNVMSVSPAGVKFHTYYPAPRPTTVVDRTRHVPLGEDLLLRSHLLTPVPTFEVSRAIMGDPALDPRRRTSASTDHFHYLVTERDAEGHPHSGDARFSFVRVDKGDGSEIGRLRITDRSPRFVFDPASGTVFLYSGRQQVQALRFSLIDPSP